jgi:four helix bundle protein
MGLGDMRMYQAAEALCAEVEKLLPRAYAAKPNAAKHLERAMDSVLFNAAEGIGAYEPRLKITPYDIARKEANEVQSTIRKLVIVRVFDRAETQRANNLAMIVAAMLTKAIIAQEKRRDGVGE